MIKEMVGSFEILDHTADLKFKFSGEDLKDLLNQSAKGLSFYLFESFGKKKEKTYKKKFKSKGLDFFIEFLNELLYLMQYKSFLPSEIGLLESDNYEVIFKGEKIREKPRVEIKAATYHNAIIERDGNKLKAIIIFDL